MHYIIYLSAGTGWFSKAELQEILAVSVVNNRRDNITGMLLYPDGNFIQLLEGEESAVTATYNRISADERHSGITVIAGGTIAQRSFPNWAMGFRAVDAASLSAFTEFPTGTDTGHISISLLKAFMATARM